MTTSSSQRYAFLDVDCVVCKFDAASNGGSIREHDRIVALATRTWFQTLTRSIASRDETFVVATTPKRGGKRHGIHLYAQGPTVASLRDSIDAFVRELSISSDENDRPRTSMTSEEVVGCFPLLLDKNCVRSNVEYLEETNPTYTSVRVFSTDPRADRRMNRALMTSTFQQSSPPSSLEDYLYEDKTLLEIRDGLQGANVSPLPSFVTTLNNLRDNAVCREVAIVAFESFRV